jgi:hypothetical protein
MLYCTNPGAALGYVQVFNALASAVTVGTTVPLQSYGVPPSSQVGGLAIPVSGLAFSTAISVAATTTAKGSVASTPLDCNASFN